MLTSAYIKEKAKQLGATVCGIGGVYDEPNLQQSVLLALALQSPEDCIVQWKTAISIIPIPLSA